MKKFLTLIVSIFFFTNVYGDNIEIFQFTDKELDTLKVRKIRGAKNLTNYSLGNNEKGNFSRKLSELGSRLGFGVQGLGRGIGAAVGQKWSFRVRRMSISLGHGFPVLS